MTKKPSNRVVLVLFIYSYAYFKGDTPRLRAKAWDMRQNPYPRLDLPK